MENTFLLDVEKLARLRSLWLIDFISGVFALSATSFLLPEKKGGKETGHRVAFCSNQCLLF